EARRFLAKLEPSREVGADQFEWIRDVSHLYQSRGDRLDKYTEQRRICGSYDLCQASSFGYTHRVCGSRGPCEAGAKSSTARSAFPNFYHQADFGNPNFRLYENLCRHCRHATSFVVQFSERSNRTSERN